ncbi:DUF3037 domain-containing protein [Rudaeicoccus suwonensis]|uniref:DUF3037 family protein n=1 Tax=Rudaeicoccus suwonensis TaxID=657409 RepID=A0A561EAU8_9MICO|nr:DUF3037 domain-containing protein [Rudaeicoccus suwonensis]TWE12726.1 DUF3037 family protein [Rudaeicoccus suwonensis]
MSLGYQYVVLRCVPAVEREEYLNVGVVLYSQMGDFLAAEHDVNPLLLQAFSPGIDLAGLASCLTGVDAVCRGEAAPGRPDLPTLRQRFGWLSAPRSTVLQPGPIHGGVTDDPARELRRLLATMVTSR